MFFNIEANDGSTAPPGVNAPPPAVRSPMTCTAMVYWDVVFVRIRLNEAARPVVSVPPPPPKPSHAPARTSVPYSHTSPSRYTATPPGCCMEPERIDTRSRGTFSVGCMV